MAQPENQPVRRASSPEALRHRVLAPLQTAVEVFCAVAFVGAVAAAHEFIYKGAYDQTDQTLKKEAAGRQDVNGSFPDPYIRARGTIWDPAQEQHNIGNHYTGKIVIPSKSIPNF